MKQWSGRLQAFLLFVGTIVGVGMFGIPFVFMQAGFFAAFIEFLITAALVAVVHYAYAEIVLSTEKAHRLPGYVRMYLGKHAGWLSSASYFFGLSGSLLAYIVLGGFFLGQILHWLTSSISVSAGPYIFYTLGVLIIFRGVRFEGIANTVLTACLIGVIALAGFMLAPHIQFHFYTNAAQGASSLFVAYGVFVFALAGGAVLPDVRRMLGRRSFDLGIVALFGTATAALLYLVFAFSVVGVMGPATSQDAITSVANSFGGWFGIIGSLIGFLAAITSFIPLGEVLAGTLSNDLELSGGLAHTVMAIIPMALFLTGFQNFIAIIGTVGAIALGVDNTLILLVHHKAVAWSSITISEEWLIAFLFIFGVLFGLIHILGI